MQQQCHSSNYNIWVISTTEDNANQKHEIQHFFTNGKLQNYLYFIRLEQWEFVLSY